MIFENLLEDDEIVGNPEEFINLLLLSIKSLLLLLNKFLLMGELGSFSYGVETIFTLELKVWMKDWFSFNWVLLKCSYTFNSW